MKSIYAFCLLIFSLLASHVYPVVPNPKNGDFSPQQVQVPKNGENLATGQISPAMGVSTTSQNPSTSTVLAYVVEQAKKVGVNPIIAEWIVGHESQYGQNLIGDDGQSLGYWMISKEYHPEVPTSCSQDLQCSTSWSLNWIKQGNQDQWTTWRFRCKWYPKENPPYCNGTSD